jgi:transposase-like protein
VTGQVRNRPVYAAIGVDLAGHKDVLGLWAGAGGGESAKFWLAVLTDLKNRGVGDIFFVVCDGLKGLPDAVGGVFPATIVQASSVDTAGGGMVSPVTATPGEDLCRRVAFEARTQTCPSWWWRAA